MDHQTSSAGYNLSPLLNNSSLKLHGQHQLFTSLPHASDSQPTASGSGSGSGPPATKKRKTTKGARNGSADASADAESGSGNNSGNGNGNGQEEKGETRKRPQSCDVCRARKVKCVKPAGAPRCEGCVSLDQRCEYTHERKKPGPANSFARKPSPTRQYTSTSNSSTSQQPSNAQNNSFSLTQHQPNHVRTYSNDGPTGPINFEMPPPRWPTPSQPTLNQSNLFSAPQQPVPQNPFGFPSATAQIAASAGFNLDASFLPMSPQSLLHPQPGEQDSASEGSPMGRWSWISGFEDIWDPKPDGWLDPSLSGAGGNGGSGSNTFLDQMLPLFDTTPGLGVDSASGPPTAGTSNSGHTSSSAQQAIQKQDQPQTQSRGQGEKERMVRFDSSKSLGLAANRHSMDIAAAMAHRGARLEDVAPLSTITRILHGYYAHLYALMPVVHWPTFSQQLVAREDERSEAWRAFVLSLVAYSIIQLPRSVLAFLPVRELRRLHQRCHAESRKLQNRSYREIRLIDIATLYCDHIYLGTLGRTHLANVLLAEAIRLAQTMNLHDERLGEPVNNTIERETRRRVFWLLYGSDRTITALTSVPMHIQDCDLCLPLPLAIDDSLLTTAGSFPQPPNQTPLLAGFHFNCRMYRLLGAVQTAHRNIISSSSNPTTDPYPMLQLPPVPVHIRPSREFMAELDRMIVDLPGPLQLVNPTSNTPTGPAQSTDGEPKDSGFATCRANLLISQAMVRFAIRQYARAAGEMEAGGVDWAERDVLHLLESMSSESLAANGESLRRKVLFVASSLLEKYPSSAEGHSYVADFLAVYTRISEEQHAALLEESAAPSRESSPPRPMSAGGSGLVSVES